MSLEQDVVAAAEDPDPESAGSSLEEETEQKEEMTISKTIKEMGNRRVSQPEELSGW